MSIDEELSDTDLAQRIYMPCDNASKMIRDCFLGNWEDLQASLDDAELVLQERRKSFEWESRNEKSRMEIDESLHIDHQTHPCKENGFKGLKGSDRLAALEAMEAADDAEDKNLNPEYLSLADQVLPILNS